MKKIILLLSFMSLLGQVFADTNTHRHTHKHHHHKHHGHATNSSNTASVSSVIRSKNSSVTTAKNPSSDIVADALATTTETKSIRHQPRLYSYSAIARDARSDKILVSKNPNVQLPIASITKLMTAMVLLDSGANLDEYVTISSSDIDTLRNTFSRLRVGMQLRRRDLLLLALMSSENRAAHALGRTAYPGGLKVFLEKMNAKAKSLGMLHTHFYDPTGLTTANQSTAEDLSKMVEAAFDYPDIREDTTTKAADVMLGTHYTHRYINSDALVRAGKFPVSLSKTGFINEAGHCLVLYSIINKKPIIMVFLNSAGKSGRLLDAMSVRNYIQKQD